MGKGFIDQRTGNWVDYVEQFNIPAQPVRPDMDGNGTCGDCGEPWEPFIDEFGECFCSGCQRWAGKAGYFPNLPPIPLKLLYEIGLGDNNTPETARRFELWKGTDSACYYDEHEARQHRPECFQDVETRYGQADITYREYTLTDGRVIIKRGWFQYHGNPHGQACYYIKR